MSIISMAGALASLGAQDCAHHPPQLAPASFALSPVCCVEDLTGAPVDQEELDTYVKHLNELWAELVPDFDQEVLEVILHDNPFVVYLTGGLISCTHVATGGFPNEPSKCIGLWPVKSQVIFIQRNELGIHCTALGHELSHVYSWIFLDSADADHKNKKIWGKKGLVERLENSYPKRCKS